MNKNINPDHLVPRGGNGSIRAGVAVGILIGTIVAWLF